MDSVDFTKMADGTAEEYAFLARREKEYVAELSNRLLSALENLKGSLAGYKVSRFEHSLQSATRAYNSGESEELVVAALLHDIGDDLAPASHSEMAAAILRPYVSKKTHWIVKHHGLFQTYYYNHHLGKDKNARDLYKDHDWFDACAHFCEHYDQNCFDPEFESKPLSFFRPMVERVFAEPKEHFV